MIRHALWIAAKDLRIELRARDVVPTMTLFAALIAILSAMSLIDDPSAAEGANVGTLQKFAPGVLWISITFAGTLGLSRTWGRERDEGALKGLLLSPVSPAALFFGKALGAFVFVLATELVIVPLVVLMFDLPVLAHLGGMVAFIVLGTVGFVLAGTLFGAMTVRTRARDLLLAIVLYPLVSPALLCGVVGTRMLFEGRGHTLWELMDLVKLLVAFDTIFAVGGAWLMGVLLTD